jgi:Ca2+-binding RTX toxin-like protein
MSFIGGSATATPDGGSASSHAFVISALPSDSGAVPRITDFDPATDTVLLSHQVFAALAQGPLPPDAFFAGPAAHDANDRIIYNQTTGALSYDSNGSASGAGTVLAMVNPGLALQAKNFLVA